MSLLRTLLLGGAAVVLVLGVAIMYRRASRVSAREVRPLTPVVFHATMEGRFQHQGSVIHACELENCIDMN